MKLSYSKKILILSLVVLIGVVILNVIFINLLLGRISDINSRVEQLNASSLDREKALSLNNSVASSKPEREELAGYFIAAGDTQTLEFTKSLESLAKANGLTYAIKSLNYEPVPSPETSEMISFIRFNFNVSGPWNDVFVFLQSIENLPKVISVNSISLDLDSELGAAGKSTGQSWSASLDFSVGKLKI